MTKRRFAERSSYRLARAFIRCVQSIHSCINTRADTPVGLFTVFFTCLYTIHCASGGITEPFYISLEGIIF